MSDQKAKLHAYQASNRSVSEIDPAMNPVDDNGRFLDMRMIKNKRIEKRATDRLMDAVTGVLSEIVRRDPDAFVSCLETASIMLARDLDAENVQYSQMWMSIGKALGVVYPHNYQVTPTDAYVLFGQVMDIISDDRTVDELVAEGRIAPEFIEPGINEFRIVYYKRSTQDVNECAASVTHIPSGMWVESSYEQTREANVREAIRLIRAELDARTPKSIGDELE